MPSLVELRPVNRDDVKRLAGWLDDPEDISVPAGADLMHSGG